jgi:ABC-type antimicrobial peptide transport system permease subunit
VLIPGIRRAVLATAPTAAIYRIQSFSQVMPQVSLNRKALTSPVVCFGALALLIATFGVYATVAYGTRLRFFEFAIRQVEGASPGQVLMLVLGELVLLLLGSGAVGVAIAYTIAQGLHSLLYGVSRLDAVVYLGSVALISGAVFVAAALSIWRAARLNPAQILNG